jgi:retron-type reverse transcriptase
VYQFAEELREELVRRTYRPLRVRKVGIPKEGGKVRNLSIPAIRDRVVQGALKLILEPIFKADFQPGSFGYRPKKTPQEAIQRVASAILQYKTHVIDLDLRSYFDTATQYILLGKVARRVGDEDVLRLLRLMRSSGKRGVPQGGVLRLREELAKLEVEVNESKSRIVDLAKGGELRPSMITTSGISGHRRERLQRDRPHNPCREECR